MGELVGGKVQGPGYSVEFNAEENEARVGPSHFPAARGTLQARLIVCRLSAHWEE